MTGRELLTLPEYERPPAHLRFSADGSQLFGVDDEGMVRIWESSPNIRPVLRKHLTVPLFESEPNSP